ncbi:MAG: hypothetical protein ACI9SP_004821 [Arenicella sp.]|jgi:hypothetical protein
MGDVYEKLVDIELAIEAYEESLEIAQLLADRFPDHPQFQSDVVITKRRLVELGSEVQRNEKLL